MRISQTSPFRNRICGGDDSGGTQLPCLQGAKFQLMLLHLLQVSDGVGRFQVKIGETRRKQVNLLYSGLCCCNFRRALLYLVVGDHDIIDHV